MSDEQQGTAPAEPSGEQTQETTQTTPEPKPGETAAQAARRWKLQVEGREEEVDDAGLLQSLLETHGEEGLRNIAQLSKAARRKMGELSHKEKQLLAAAEDLKNPKARWSLLERIAGGRDKLRAELEDWYAGDIEERQLSPEARRLRELETKLSRYEAEEKRKREEAEKAAEAQQQQQLQRSLGQQFSQALRQIGEEPDAVALAQMAFIAEQHAASDGSFDPLEVAREWQRDYTDGRIAQRIRRHASDPEKLVKLIGEDAVRALRQYDVQRVKAKQAPLPAAAPAPQRPREERKRMSIDDYERELERRRSGG